MTQEQLTAAELRARQATAPGKYLAKATIYRGVRFRSKLEAQYAQHLDASRLLHPTTGPLWRRSPRFYLDINGARAGWYTPDFVVDQLGSRRYVEVKGFDAHGFRGATDWQFRARVFLALNPTLRLVVARRTSGTWVETDARAELFAARRTGTAKRPE